MQKRMFLWHMCHISNVRYVIKSIVLKNSFYYKDKLTYQCEYKCVFSYPTFGGIAFHSKNMDTDVYLNESTYV